MVVYCCFADFRGHRSARPPLRGTPKIAKKAGIAVSGRRISAPPPLFTLKKRTKSRRNAPKSQRAAAKACRESPPRPGEKTPCARAKIIPNNLGLSLIISLLL